jgi:DNA-binding response OmpR family regulator
MTHLELVVCTDPMRNPFPVLMASSNEEDHALFEIFLSGVGYTVHHAWTLADALSILGESRVAVVITERTLPDGSWVGVQVSSESPCNPPLVIVFSDPGDATFWAQAFNLGAFDVLHRPLDETIVARAVNLANLRWSRTVEAADARSTNPCRFPRAAPLMYVAQPHPYTQVSSTTNGLGRGMQRASSRA